MILTAYILLIGLSNYKILQQTNSEISGVQQTNFMWSQGQVSGGSLSPGNWRTRLSSTWTPSISQEAFDHYLNEKKNMDYHTNS